MKAIIEIQGHQYTVQAGDLVDVELLNETAEKTIQLKNILLIEDGTETRVGKPVLEDSFIEAKIIKHALAPKQIVLRRKPGKYMKKNGHRQKFTSLLITTIQSGSKSSKIKEDSGRFKKYLDKKD